MCHGTLPLGFLYVVSLRRWCFSLSKIIFHPTGHVCVRLFLCVDTPLLMIKAQKHRFFKAKTGTGVFEVSKLISAIIISMGDRSSLSPGGGFSLCQASARDNTAENISAHIATVEKVNIQTWINSINGVANFFLAM
jgi:hypothetical protein